MSPGHGSGRLTVYLGAAPGVGKTFKMLDEARRRRARGTDVVVGLVETHGRDETAAAVGDLEVVPRRTVTHRGATLTELDVDAVLARAPEVVLVDELAHTNAPGSDRTKRWEDVHVLLGAGIDVITTVNVQHLESLGADVEAITGVVQRETVPDRVVRDADQIQLIDLSPHALRRRLAHGSVYRPEQIDASLASYFREGNLTALRELALLWLADRVDDALTRYRDDHAITGTWPARERVVVAVTGGPEGATLLRRGARIVERAAGSELHAVHVLATDGLPGPPAGAITAARRLVESLGGTFHTVVGEDVASAVVDFARGINATMVVVGTSRHSRWREAVVGSTGSRVAQLAGSIDVHLVTHERARSEPLVRGRWSVLTRRRRVAGWMLGLLLPVLLVALLGIGDGVDLSVDVLLYLVGVVAVALVGGMWPALVSAVLAFACLNWFFTPPTGRFTVASTENLVTLLVFVVVAASVAAVVDVSARRAAEASQARAEASTLAGLSRSVLAGEDSASAIVERLVETFGVRAARLEERSSADGRWEVVASAGALAVASAGAGTPAPRADRRFASAEAHANGPCVGDAAGGGGEGSVVDVDGARRLVLVGDPLPAADRQVLEAFAAQAGVVLERRRLAAQASRAAALEEAAAVRQALLAAVSHDLRTPLASIRAAVDGLTAEDVDLDPVDEAGLVATVDESTARLERLIDNLLDLSRLQAGGLAPTLRAASLDEVVPLALEQLPAGRVELLVPDDLPLVRTDPGLLERVVANVVGNAVRFQPTASPVQVTASADRTHVEVRVVDRGRGVPDDQKTHMFDAFQRLDDSSPGGLGLGLAVARGLASAAGATLVPEDTPGGGLTMVLRLPRADRAAPAAGEKGDA
ncbi:DUF4118 domain-containing protein [Luteimicrobium subarcticum]|uniref:histidine kinase n=1 Tax=Luteimicrobium subarcticum TaxID=620910 RepID=A0A2M8W6T7_9MICO|nr:DUF4118 domain-containing protein [Luteimicrobium subarcticum]PJI86645.1 osmosensitive K+ channel signal transduction histidine kinase [Luteimicrobium subarcticum]